MNTPSIPPEPGARPIGQSQWLRLTMSALGVAAVVYAVRQATPQLGSLGREASAIPLTAYAAALAMSLGVFALEGVLWWRALETIMGKRLPAREATFALCSGNVAKYVPGRLWAIVFQSALLAEQGVGLGTTASLNVAINIVSLWGAAITGGIAAALAPLPAPARAAAAGGALAAAAIAIAAGIALSPGAKFTGRLRVLGLLPERVRAPVTSLLGHAPLYVGSYALGWLVHGLTAVVLLSAASGLPNAATSVPGIIAAMVLSAAAGAAAVIAPGGLGVREAVLYLALPGLDPGWRLAIPLLTRALTLAAEVGAYFLSLAWMTFGSRRASRAAQT